MRFVLCRGRYLHPLRHGAKHRATSPYAGETLPFGNVFTMPEQLDHALPSPQGEGFCLPQVSVFNCGAMRKKILRCAQNDKKYAESPQAFPSEGKGDRRTAVDEVEKRVAFYI